MSTTTARPAQKCVGKRELKKQQLRKELRSYGRVLHVAYDDPYYHSFTVTQLRKELSKAKKATAKAEKQRQKLAAGVARRRQKQIVRLAKLLKIPVNDPYIVEVTRDKTTAEEIRVQIEGEKEGLKEEAARLKVIKRLQKAACKNHTELGSLDGFELPQLRVMLAEEKAKKTRR